MSNDPDTDRFEISAAVVFRLGDELITDVAQALAELVKNSYDADATWVRVKIETHTADGKEVDEGGLISVEDNGHGMTESDLRRGWLMIAGSSKRGMKDKGEKTERGRTPVGDKGLGRLGVQRLGNDISITTRSKKNPDQLVLSFSWKDFTNAKKLSDVPVKMYSEPRKTKRNGTLIEIKDLKESDQWIGSDAKNRLQRELTELISPFKEVRNFTVNVTLNGIDIPIAEVADNIRNAAAVRYQIDFDGSQLKVTGKARLDFCARAQSRQDRERLKDLLDSDNGKSFFEFLKEHPRGAPPSLELSRDNRWFVNFHYVQNLSDLGGVRLDQNKAASPGPFEGEVDYLLLNPEEIDTNVWDSKSEFKKFVSELSGIRVYRNGFGIRLGDDWLNLGSQQTSGGSIYGLRPKNVIGYISIDASDNSSLMETTSREGFQKNANYVNFYNLLQRFVSWSSDAQEYLRRSAIEYLKSKNAEQNNIENNDDTRSVTGQLKRHAIKIDEDSRSLEKQRASIKKITRVASEEISSLRSSSEQLSLYDQKRIDDLESMIQRIEIALTQLEEELLDSRDLDTAPERAQRILEVVLEREEKLREELSLFYDGIALGLTAEALAHEISNITDNLSKRLHTMAEYLRKNNYRDTAILKFLEHLKTAISALRKQVSHLDPSLRYVREQREKIELSEEVLELKEFYSPRLQRSNITLSIQVQSSFSVKINRGKLRQIIDNLILNSEYWLKHRKEMEPQFRPNISIEISKPYLIVFDNGYGISQSIEDFLFDPFTTQKVNNGRGLGLFIIKQLLDSEDCGILLSNERNKENRKYKFVIDWSGALYE